MTPVEICFNDPSKRHALVKPGDRVRMHDDFGTVLVDARGLENGGTYRILEKDQTLAPGKQVYEVKSGTLAVGEEVSHNYLGGDEVTVTVRGS